MSDVAEATAEFSVESLLDDLERVTKERDGYLDDTRRVAAEFANFRRQTDKRHPDVVEQAAAGSSSDCCRCSMPATAHSRTARPMSSRSTTC